MGRTTVYNNITSPEKLQNINKENKSLIEDFLQYLESIGRAQTTIKNYRADLLIFFCWVLDELNNKSFIEITKREIARFQNKAIKEWGWSSNRLRTVKAAVASLGNFVENVADDTYPNFRSIIRKVESPPKQEVRTKTVWEDDEVEALLKKLSELEEYEKACFIALAAYSGRRKSELCRFKTSDFMDDKLVFGGSLYKSDPIKTKGRGNGKFIPCYTIASKFKPYLDQWLLKRNSCNINSEWLFPDHTDTSRPLSPHSVDSWTAALTKIANKEVYLHSFRHYFTTFLLKSGIPEGVVQTIIAWQSADMIKIYDDRSNDEQIAEYFKDGEITCKEQNQLSKL